MTKDDKPEKERGNELKWGKHDATVSAATMRKLVEKIKRGELKVDWVDSPEADGGKGE